MNFEKHLDNLKDQTLRERARKAIVRGRCGQRVYDTHIDMFRAHKGEYYRVNVGCYRSSHTPGRPEREKILSYFADRFDLKPDVFGRKTKSGFPESQSQSFPDAVGKLFAYNEQEDAVKFFIELLNAATELERYIVTTPN